MAKLRQLLSSIRVPKNLADFESLESSKTLTNITTPMSGDTDDSSDYGSWTDPSLAETESEKENTVVENRHIDLTLYNTPYRLPKSKPKEERTIDLEEARRLIANSRNPVQKKQKSLGNNILCCFCCCHSAPKSPTTKITQEAQPPPQKEEETTTYGSMEPVSVSEATWDESQQSLHNYEEELF